MCLYVGFFGFFLFVIYSSPQIVRLLLIFGMFSAIISLSLFSVPLYFSSVLGFW